MNELSIARRQRGQGLAEFAISLPLLLLVLAGVLEVANLILLYSRMDLAAREGARFGALGGTDIGVREVFYQNASETLEIEPGVVEVWIVRPVLENGGSSFRWQGSGKWGSAVEECIYPEEGCENADSGIDSQKVLDHIASSGAQHDEASGDRFVIVGIYYEAKTILNLPFFQIGGETGRVPMRAEAIFRQEISQQTVNRLAGGCSAYPIALSPGIAGLAEAGEGTRFTVSEGSTGANTWTYLAWNQGQIGNSGSLENALAYPGSDYQNYVNAAKADDKALHRGDMVWGQPAASSGTAMADHVSHRRTLRVILHDGSSYNYDPVGTAYRVQSFVIIRAVGYSGGQFTFEFVRNDTSCGESQTGT
jgi:hypothetical protein